MNYSGYAFSPDADATARNLSERYFAIKDLPGIELTKTPQRGRTEFRGSLSSDQARELSEFDLLLYADGGNLCFGGECFRSGDEFYGSYNTD